MVLREAEMHALPVLQMRRVQDRVPWGMEALREMRKYIRIPADYKQKYKRLSDEQFGMLIRGLMEYQRTGQEATFEDLLVAIAFDCEKFDLDEMYAEEAKKEGRNNQEYRNWRADVLERDEYTCQYCGKKGGVLNAHHKKEYAKYPELRYEVENGVTLCEECHRKVHKGEIEV